MAPTPRLALFSIVASLAYLGLAILGRGGFSAFFSHAALSALAIVLLVLTAVALFSGGNLSPGEREDRGNRWVLAAFGVIGLLAAYLPAYTDRTDFWTIDGDAVRWLGVVLFAAGGALRIWPVFVLGHRFSGLVAIQPGHLRRHPSSQLSGLAGERAGMGAGVSFRGRRAAHRANDPAATCAHPGGRKAAARTIRRRLRSLSAPHLSAHSPNLLANLQCGNGRNGVENFSRALERGRRCCITLPTD